MNATERVHDVIRQHGRCLCPGHEAYPEGLQGPQVGDNGARADADHQKDMQALRHERERCPVRSDQKGLVRGDRQ